MKLEAEIINPSDKAFCDASDWETACIAVCVVGEGKYGLKLNEEKTMPIFLFGGSEEYFKKEFGKTVEESFSQVDKKKLAACLRSFRLTRERSSLNDFTGYAHKLAKRFEKVKP